jgi:hypothetical protein
VQNFQTVVYFYKIIFKIYIYINSLVSHKACPRSHFLQVLRETEERLDPN